MMCSYKHVLSVYLKELKAKKAPDAQPSKFDGIGTFNAAIMTMINSKNKIKIV